MSHLQIDYIPAFIKSIMFLTLCAMENKLERAWAKSDHSSEARGTRSRFLMGQRLEFKFLRQ